MLSYVQNYKELKEIKIDHNKFSTEQLQRFFEAVIDIKPVNLEKIQYTSFMTNQQQKTDFANLMKEGLPKINLE